MATAAQATIIKALGFEAAEETKVAAGWKPGAFSEDGQQIIVRNLPFSKEVNTILKSVGCCWDTEKKEWFGSDATQDAVDVFEALQFCSGRAYQPWDGISEPKRCPVRVGAYT